MEKAKFTYTKSDGTSKERQVYHPKFLKESYNSFSSIDNEKVNYLQGYEKNKDNLSEDQVKEYEEVISDYFELAIPTIEEFLSENGLDPSRIQYKTFSKDKISNLDG